jgi:hypothetical protein
MKPAILHVLSQFLHQLPVIISRNAATLLVLIFFVSSSVSLQAEVLKPEKFKPYIDWFNSVDDEPFKETIPNAKAWEFLEANIPFFECPDKYIEQTYYFRWWSFRKHLVETPEGWVITEFTPKVHWSGPFNTINCANGHHHMEGRWLKDPKYVADSIRFWLKARHANYSTWIQASIWEFCLTTGNFDLGTENLPDLMKVYSGWDSRRDKPTGLMFSIDQGDGMEASISGKGFRPTLNSYMYGNALAIAQFAERAGKTDIAQDYQKKAAELKEAVQKLLWNPEIEFFQVREAPLELGFFGWRVNNDPALTGTANLTTSDPKKPKNLVGGEKLRNGYDWSLPRAHLVPAGAQHFMQYDFPEAVTLSSTELFPVFGGRTGLPESFKLFYRENGEWKEVANLQGSINEHHRWNKLSFSPIQTDGLRLEVNGYGYTRETLQLKENVRELVGYIPWYFNLPDPQYSVAWKFLTDPKGFSAPWGLTTAEQQHPKFAIEYHRHPCLWNGPSWPYATSQTLTALANLLNNYPPSSIDKSSYLSAISTYAKSHELTLEDGQRVPWVDECQDPFTGVWIARSVIQAGLKEKPEKLKRPFVYMERGKDYNHSTFCDLVINGLVGVRPQADNTVVINPLVPQNAWDYFCLDRVPYHGRMLTVLWDKTGNRYGKGTGLRVYADGKEIAHSEELSKLECKLP